MAARCQVEIQSLSVSYSPMMHSKTMGEIFQRHQGEQGVTFPSEAPVALSYSTDMGDVSLALPSIHPSFSIGSAMLHTKEFCRLAGADEAQTPTLSAAISMALTSVEILLAGRVGFAAIEREFLEGRATFC